MTELHQTNRFISLLITQSALYILIFPARNHHLATGDFIILFYLFIWFIHFLLYFLYWFSFPEACSVFLREMPFCMPPFHFSECAVSQEVMYLKWSPPSCTLGVVFAELSWFYWKMYLCAKLHRSDERRGSAV